MNSQMHAMSRCRVPEDPKTLRETIVLMEARLRTLGDGDCAYEKAMIRFYEQQLTLHRARLVLCPASRGM